MPRLLAVFFALLLSSCFDIREEIWIGRDGSGRIDFTYVVPSQALTLAGGEEEIRKSVETMMSSEPGMHLDRFDITPTDRGTRIEIEARIDTLDSLLDLKESDTMTRMPPIGEKLMGTFDIRLSPQGIDFERHIDAGAALGLARLAISPAERRERKMEYIIHLPTSAKSTNADQVLDEGRTLVWKRSLGEALSSPLRMGFQAPLPIPLWALILVPLLLGLGLFFTLRWLRKRRLRRKSA
ncbi:MAG: hypothetical protein MUF31_09770 [Akkermansiaceae bacterium]|jgi:hypothetical protein|nr:hypothetical protein [Akkermansiaceae bacterium]